MYNRSLHWSCWLADPRSMWQTITFRRIKIFNLQSYMFIRNNLWTIISSTNRSRFNFISKISLRNISLILFVDRWVIILLFSPNKTQTQLTRWHCNVLFMLGSIEIYFIIIRRWVFLIDQLQCRHFVIILL